MTTIHLSAFTVSQLQGEANRLQSLVGEVQAQLGDITRRLIEVRAELDKRTMPALEPRVSEHAQLQYLRRVLHMGDVIDSLPGRMLSEVVVAAIKAGATAVVIDGVKFKVSNNVIVTVYPKTEYPKAELPRVQQERHEVTYPT